MAYVVALTKSRYQYKVSIPSRLIDATGLCRESVLVLSECGDGTIIIKRLERGKDGNTEDRKS